jgi:hypothetical protein
MICARLKFSIVVKKKSKFSGQKWGFDYMHSGQKGSFDYSGQKEF